MCVLEGWGGGGGALVRKGKMGILMMQFRHAMRKTQRKNNKKERNAINQFWAPIQGERKKIQNRIQTHTIMDYRIVYFGQSERPVSFCHNERIARLGFVSAR